MIKRKYCRKNNRELPIAGCIHTQSSSIWQQKLQASVPSLALIKISRPAARRATITTEITQLDGRRTKPAIKHLWAGHSAPKIESKVVCLPHRQPTTVGQLIARPDTKHENTEWQKPNNCSCNISPFG